MRSVAVGVVIASVVACSAPTILQPRTPRYDEITALWTQIREWRKEAHMPLDPFQQDVIQMANRPAKEARLTCPDHHAVPKTCNDVCNLADDICDNAERICDLADQLGKQDDWAQGKCASAKASCREAKQKCCECSKKEEQPQ